MSEPVTQAEIEDVLSSIRRLVSETGRLEAGNPAVSASNGQFRTAPINGASRNGAARNGSAAEGMHAAPVDAIAVHDGADQASDDENMGSERASAAADHPAANGQLGPDATSGTSGRTLYSKLVLTPALRVAERSVPLEPAQEQGLAVLENPPEQGLASSGIDTADSAHSTVTSQDESIRPDDPDAPWRTPGVTLYAAVQGVTPSDQPEATERLKGAEQRALTMVETPAPLSHPGTEVSDEVSAWPGEAVPVADAAPSRGDAPDTQPAFKEQALETADDVADADAIETVVPEAAPATSAGSSVPDAESMGADRSVSETDSKPRQPASPRVAAVVRRIAELEHQSRGSRAPDINEDDMDTFPPQARLGEGGVDWSAEASADAASDDGSETGATAGQQPGDLGEQDFVHQTSQMAERALVSRAMQQIAEGEALMDEESLRRLVSDTVREELQGPLGERITRNVRKLVRREIQRALAAQDLL